MGYAEERIELLPRLRKLTPGRALADALKLDGRALRFQLGTSLADLRVPVHIGAALEAAVVAAARDLYFLLCLRHRAALREAEYDQLLLQDGFDPRALRPVSFAPPGSVTREGIRRAFVEAPELHPALDSGLLASWIASGRPGRVLVGALNALLRRAMEEAAAADPQEPTPYLAMLALRSLADPARTALRSLSLAPPLGRGLQGAVAAGLLLATRLAAREAGLSAGPAGAQAEAAVIALPWLGGLRFLPGSCTGAYGLALSELPPHLEQLSQKLLQGGTPDSIAREARAELAQSKEAQRKAARAAALSRLRGELLSLLRLVEAGRAPPFSLDVLTLAQLFQTPGALERVTSAPALRKELAARAKATAKAATNEAARALLESISLGARELGEDDPSAYAPPEVVTKTWALSTMVLAIDAAVDRALDAAEGQLVHRTGTESDGGIETQHEAGKLYLFSMDETPILQGRAGAPQMAHLFCDMKDFTKRTAFLKETVVADFLSREFYGPILTAAARHQHGAAHLADKGGIYLNNLLGDAVSFSGDIVGLLELTEDIRAALQSYAKRLDSEASSESVARMLAAVEAKYGARKEELASAVRTAALALRKGTLDPVSGEEPAHRIRMLEGELARLEDERTTELALVSGEKLEAGIFISYGAAPEVATFEDAVFGPIKVSIAEKINESARGTARNGAVRARVDAMLAAERLRRGRPELICPLTVAIAEPLTMPVSGAAEVAVRRCLAAGDLEGAETVLAEPVRDFVAKLASSQGQEGDRGDIYNGGAAISEEALRAYIAARGSELIFLRRELEVGALHPALGERFVFPTQTLRFVLAVSPAAQALLELYVHVGRALFKGFERSGGLGIYELVPRDHPFFLLLAQHHLLPWLREHEEGHGAESGEWWPLGLEKRTGSGA